MFKKRNQDIRSIAKENKIPYYAIAERLNVHVNTFQTMLNKEIEQETKERIIKIIEELKGD